jgi:hypothetical protein
MVRYQHHASYVMMDLTRRASAIFSEDAGEARALFGLIADLEKLYPEAAAELAALYDDFRIES